MEVYLNRNWTECYGNSYIAEAVAWSENSNHATVYTTGTTAEEANDRLLGALRELKLVPQTTSKDERQQKGS